MHALIAYHDYIIVNEITDCDLLRCGIRLNCQHVE